MPFSPDVPPPETPCGACLAVSVPGGGCVLALASGGTELRRVSLDGLDGPGAVERSACPMTGSEPESPPWRTPLFCAAFVPPSGGLPFEEPLPFSEPLSFFAVVPVPAEAPFPVPAEVLRPFSPKTPFPPEPGGVWGGLVRLLELELLACLPPAAVLVTAALTLLTTARATMPGSPRPSPSPVTAGARPMRATMLSALRATLAMPVMKSIQGSTAAPSGTALMAESISLRKTTLSTIIRCHRQ